MGKRNAIVISSSEDDDYRVLSGSSANHLRSVSKPSSVPRTNPKRAKKVRGSKSCSRSCKDSNPFDEIRLLNEEFGEGFNGFKVPSGCRGNQDLWVDKYKPHSLEELAVHRRKVEELKIWFEERLIGKKDGFNNNVIFITGQAGVGKSATVHVIASHLGATVCEWNTPTPTLWQEHLHNSHSGIRYMSKVDEFESFVERTRKYGLASSSFSGQSQTSIILLIDDLPVINGRISYEKLHRCLHLLVQSVCIPTAILITDNGKSDSADYSTRCWEEIQSSLLSAGACKVSFNPITVNSIKRTLSKVCKEEQCDVTAEQIDLIAKASGGDIRHAITSLQYFSLRSRQTRCSFSSKEEILDEIGCLNDEFSLPFGRDETLSLFHALGKFLHNKREDADLISLDKNGIVLRDRFVRLPPKMESPEKILCQAHGQARHVTDFLHENFLDFVSEEEIEDAWVVASYLSDADSLLCLSTGMLTRAFEVENFIQSAAASVAARGVLFGNSQPLTSRWHAVRRPKIWQSEQSFWHNKLKMMRQRNLVYNGLHLSDLTVVATEWEPASRWLGLGASEGFRTHRGFVMNVAEDDGIGMTSADDKCNETDDDIEDW